MLHTAQFYVYGSLEMQNSKAEKLITEKEKGGWLPTKEQYEENSD